jgi:hypothetical protein
MLIASAFLIQLGFQGESLWAAWSPSRVHQAVALAGMFTGHLEHVTALENPSTAYQQGELISPLRAVTNCYDMDSFTRAEVRPGSQLLKTLRIDTKRLPADTPLDAGFMSWNRMRLLSSPALGAAAQRNSMLHIELNQAYHTGWSSTQCTLTQGEHANLVANCPARELAAGPVDLVFFDPVSELGKQVTLRAAVAMGISVGFLALLGLIPKRRTAAAPSVG